MMKLERTWHQVKAYLLSTPLTRTHHFKGSHKKLSKLVTTFKYLTSYTAIFALYKNLAIYKHVISKKLRD